MQHEVRFGLRFKPGSSTPVAQNRPESRCAQRRRCSHERWLARVLLAPKTGLEMAVSTRLHQPFTSSGTPVPCQSEPTFYEPARLWLYGNAKLLRGRLAVVEDALGFDHDDPTRLQAIEEQAERLVLEGHILVCGIHNPAHQRAAVVPLRWGASRILVVSGGFLHHLGPNLDKEPFRVARLWRYRFDPQTDLVVSRRAPGKLPTFGRHNPTVDRLIRLILNHDLSGPLFSEAPRRLAS